MVFSDLTVLWDKLYNQYILVIFDIHFTILPFYRTYCFTNPILMVATFYQKLLMIAIDDCLMAEFLHLWGTCNA